MEIKVREEHLPGVGVRWELDLPDGATLHVTAERSGRRHLGLTPRAHDEPAWMLELDQQRAVTIAALLLGARFTLDAADRTAKEADTVVVDTIELGPGSPLIGRRLSEITLPDADAMVLAIIDDETPDLVEHATEHRCEPGDRVVIAARARNLDALTQHVRGGEHDSARGALI
jgi:TrkA domain protein